MMLNTVNNPSRGITYRNLLTINPKPFKTFKVKIEPSQLDKLIRTLFNPFGIIIMVIHT